MVSTGHDPGASGRAVDNAKSDAVRVFVSRLLDRIATWRYDIREGSKAEQIYRRGWNDALEHVRRDLSAR